MCVCNFNRFFQITFYDGGNTLHSHQKFVQTLTSPPISQPNVLANLTIFVNQIGKKWYLNLVLNCISLVHVNVWQKPLQYCRVISLQLIKINGKKISFLLLRDIYFLFCEHFFSSLSVTHLSLSLFFLASWSVGNLTTEEIVWVFISLPQFIIYFLTLQKFILNDCWGDFPGSPVVRTLCFCGRGHGFDPLLATRISNALWHDQKKK